MSPMSHLNNTIIILNDIILYYIDTIMINYFLIISLRQLKRPPRDWAANRRILT